MNHSGTTKDLAHRIHLWTTFILVGIMAVELAVVVIEGQRFTAFLVLAIMALVLAPVVLARQVPVKIPAEFELLAVVFVFAALFLGEIRDYYTRIWWWDIGLHTSSGLLLGILGFLLVYVLNENEYIDLHLRPRFVATFAFLFAVTIGAAWEVFEFSMDKLLGTTMQKPMFGDPSGLTDTMCDLIVDMLGAFVISLFGWIYMRRGEQSFIVSWIHKFIKSNPGLFRQ